MPNEKEREYKTLVTTIGKSKIAATIQGSGKVNITQAAVGDGGGSYYTPTADMTALMGEVWRGNIAGKWVNDEFANMVGVKVILPADVGGFTVREAALFDGNGDMIAICNMPDTEKAVLTTGAAGSLTIIMHIILTDADAVEFKIDPNLDAVTSDDVERMILQHRETASREIIIPTTGWNTGAEECEGEELYIDIAQEDITEEMVPIISILPGYTRIAKECGMSTVSRTVPGALRLYTEKAPTEEIRANLTLLNASFAVTDGGGAGEVYVLPIATATRLGGVKIGKNISVTADGTISSEAKLPDEDLATSKDVQTMLDEVFAKT